MVVVGTGAADVSGAAVASSEVSAAEDSAAEDSTLEVSAEDELDVADGEDEEVAEALEVPALLIIEVASADEETTGVSGLLVHAARTAAPAASPAVSATRRLTVPQRSQAEVI